jgi:alpha-mannosidase
MKFNLVTFKDQRTRIRHGTLPNLKFVATRYNTLLLASFRRLTFSKYADLSEFGYGVALLSESKYGFSCIGNVLRMSLLRAATSPDAEQDQGEF